MIDVLYTSPYVPAEWITAHGLRPVRITPPADCAQGPLARQVVCSFVRCFSSSVTSWPDAYGIIMTTTCDQMRRAFDVVTQTVKAPAFLMNVPATWQSDAANDMYLGELKRLGDFMVSLGGVAPSDEHLAEVMLRIDDARASLLAQGPRIGPRQLAQAIIEFGQTGRGELPEQADCDNLNGNVPIALVGGPLRRDDLVLFDVVEEYGGCIALDGSETGLRGMCRHFDRRQVHSRPLEELADAYFKGILDILQRPNYRFYDWLGGECERLRVQAIIVHRHLWCDLWHAEVERIRRHIDLPVLDLDIDGEGTLDSNRTHTRIKAFMEMLL